jgi:PBP1b-binding outer membrane lipoprotein LpoB
MIKLIVYFWLKFFGHRLTFWEWIAYSIIGTFICFILAFSLSGCSTSRQMQKEKHQVKVDCTAIEKQVTHNDITTDIKSQLSATTETTETIDTVVNIPDPKTRMFLQVPVHMKRVIKKQEYLSTQEVTKDKSQSTAIKDIHENKAVINESKQVKAKRPNLTLYIVIAASILIVLLFVFLWKRFPLARLFDIFKRKSP